MGVVVSLLRGVNVGGSGVIRMDALRALYQSLGFHDAQTYLQSGNVVFTAGKRNLPWLTRTLEKAVERNFGLRPAIMLRTAAEMRRIVDGNPFAARAGIAPAKLIVLFLAGDPGPAARERLLTLDREPEELRISARELYLYYPNGAGRAKLAPGLIEKTLQTPATGRNWNTVTNLLTLAERLEAAAP